jgi:diguanylate cyclase (GGDEF)-like protein/PAS domain S-box-containing protein
MSLNLPQNSHSLEQEEILNALPVLVFLERAGRIVFANDMARQMLGVSDEEWVQRPVEDVLWGLFPGTAEPQTLLTGTKRGSPFHATLAARNGRLFPIEGTYSTLDAETREAVIVAHPGGRERAPKSRLMEDVLASIPEAVAIVHAGHVLYANPAFTRMFGYSAEEASGGNLVELIVPDTRKDEITTLEKQVDQHGQTSIETVRKSKAGELVDVSLVAGPLLVDGAKLGYVFSFRDISERKMMDAKLQHDAMHDVMTGLPNRTLFLDRVGLALNRMPRCPDRSCGVLTLDLDRFKEINDSLGAAAGDELLTVVAERLQSVLRPHDSAARLGGDEFSILVEDIGCADDLSTVAVRIVSEIERPFEIFGHLIKVSASMGLAMASPTHTAPELLVRDAVVAMYRAKQAGGGRLEVFDKHLGVQITDQ